MAYLEDVADDGGVRGDADGEDVHGGHGGSRSRRAASMMTARRMKVRGRRPISVDEIDKAGRRNGSEEGGGVARDPRCNIGSVDGGNRDGYSGR